MIEYTCPFCNKKFFNFPSNHRKFCSRSCLAKSRIRENSANWKGGQIKLICNICKKGFYVYIGRKNIAEFCSRSCLAKSRVGQKHSTWKGGERYSSEGYVMIYAPDHPFARKNKCVKRSRLVMEKILSRYLKPQEQVHHINEIKDDDRPKNLQVFKNNSAHRKYHTKLNKLVRCHKQKSPHLK